MPGQINQTHVKFPCLGCRKEVKEYHNALLCVHCNKWAHLRCSHASTDTFNSDANWMCNFCILKELPRYVDEPDIRSRNSNACNYESVDKCFEKLNSLSGINICHLNVSSLMKNFEEIRNILTTRNVHIFSLCETRLDGFISDPEISISGYKIVRLDRNKNGGGIITYIKDSVPFRFDHPTIYL